MCFGKKQTSHIRKNHTSIKVKGYLGSIEVVKEICGQELEGVANFVCVCVVVRNQTAGCGWKDLRPAFPGQAGASCRISANIISVQVLQRERLY